MKSTKRQLSIIFFVWIATSAARDWPCFRGADRNGISRETDWNTDIEQAPILWKADVGFGHSSFAISGERLFTLGERIHISQNDSLFTEHVFCLNRNNGKIVWEYEYACTHRNFAGPRSTPTVDGNRLYVMGTDGDLYCLDTGNGKVYWHKNLLKEELGTANNWGYCSSPLVCGDKLLINAGKSGLLLNKTNGAVIWKSTHENGGIASPVPLEGSTFLLTGDKATRAVDLETGRTTWSYEWHSYADPVPAGSILLLTGGRLGNRKGCCAVDIRQTPPRELWHHQNIGQYAFQSWIVQEEHAYGLAGERRQSYLRCIHLPTGETVWKKEIPNEGSLAAADGKLILLTGSGDLVIIKLTPQDYEEISRASVLPRPASEPYRDMQPRTCWTAPVLHQGRIYARDTHGTLACIDVSQ